MSCNIQKKTLDHFKKKGLIVENRNIPTEKLEAFNTENESLTKYAKDSKGVDMGPLFNVEDNTKERKGKRSTQFINRAIPNTKAFQAIQEFNDNNPNILEKNIGYQLKAVDILNSDKAKQVFTKGKKNNWDLNKILTELQVPKAQKQIILDKNITDREEIITSLLAENSFVVEVNTASQNFVDIKDQIPTNNHFEFKLNNDIYIRKLNADYSEDYFKNGNFISKDYFLSSFKESKRNPSQYYKGLTVPGGINYTENEITTPDIIPNIKGHAQFSTDNGIGWFRSDDKDISLPKEYRAGQHSYITVDDITYFYNPVSNKFTKFPKNKQSESVESSLDEFSNAVRKKGLNLDTSKTRRILEVQSDLFQKGRDKKSLTSEKGYTIKIAEDQDEETDLLNQGYTRTNTQNEDGYPEYSKDSLNINQNDNKFLQLLNKKNNWVNFFIESIIQDSAKKGYEKVLFPKGDTAAKIEGHQTLEEFKREKLSRISNLESQKEKISNTNEQWVIKNIDPYAPSEEKLIFGSSQEALDYINKDEYPDTWSEPIRQVTNDEQTSGKDKLEKVNNEIKTLKQELADVESGQTQLSSIAGFYENNVTNILNKKYKGRVKEVTDEHGNKWNEVELKLEDANTNFILQLQNRQDSKPEVKSFLFNPKKISKRDINKSIEETTQDNDDIINILFNGTIDTVKSNLFLRNAYNNPNLDINDEGKAFMKSLLTTRSTIKFVSKDKLKSGEDTYAQYDSDTKVISVNEDILSTGNVYYALESILHEITHDMTVRALEAPKNDNQRQFRENIISTLRYYRSKTDSDLYGFTNEAEFIAEIMTNNEFREELKNIDNGNFFTKIINFIKSMLGLNTTPNITDIIESITEVIEQESNGYTSPLQKGIILEKRVEKSKKNKPSKELQDKLLDVKDVINKILSSIEAVKKKSISSKGYDKKTQTKYQKIQKLLDKLQKEQAKDAVLEYLNFAEQELDSLIFGLDESLKAETLTNDYINRSRQYASVFNYVDDIGKIVSRMKQSGNLTRDEYNVITDSLDKVNGRYKRYINDSSNLSKDLLAQKFASYNTNPITQAKNKYKKEYKKDRPVNKTLDQYTQERLDEEIDIINQQQYDQVREQLEIIPQDISSYKFMLDNEKNISNLLIHLSSLSLDKADAEIRNASINLRNTIVNATKEYDASGSTNKARYSKLLSQDKAGNYYLISEYKPEFIEEFDKVKKAINEASREFGENSDEHNAARNKYKTWKADNITVIKGEVNGFPGVIIGQKPISKWLNPKYKQLNDKDKSYLKTLEESAIRADEKTKGINSIINRPLKNNDDLVIIKLPSVRRTDIDMILSGNIKQLVKDKTGDLGKKREDDTEYGQLTEQDLNNGIKVMSSMDGETKNTLPVHYRSPLQPKDQSLDLGTIFLLNETMATNFEVKSKLEADLIMLQEVVGEADVKQYDIVSGIKKISAWAGFNKKDHDQIIAPGDQSNVYKKLKSIIENRLYGITEVSANKIAGMDLNAISSSISGYTADLTLGLNYLSAIPNLTQAKVQNFIEGVGIGTYTRADLRFAEKEYWKQMTANGGLNDIGALKNTNKINLLIEHFDLMGDFNVVKNLIEDNTKFRALMKKGTMHSLNSMSEHYAQSTLMLAILNSVKIKNAKGQYINSEGKVVAKEEAMTMYEAFDVKTNDKTSTATLELNSKAKKSSFSESEFNDLGMIQHQNLIKKKVIDLHGQYDNKIQSHIQRHWYGKLLFMFRKWMLSSYSRRFKGVAHWKKDYENLTEEQKQYDYSLQEYDEGTYTSFLRFMKLGVYESIKNFNMEIMTTNWENLNDKERANIYKTTREAAMIALMYAGYALMQGLAEDDEENEELYYLLAFNFRRQVSELSQYANPLELMRTMRSPFAAMNTLEKTGKLLYQLVGDPIEEYKTGDRKGELKSWVKFKKLVPYVAQGERSAEQSLNFLKTLSN